tara:strand:+ start:131 stop:544 length:414 start_codon:yes stop_codon:yes gene_type:complete
MLVCGLCNRPIPSDAPQSVHHLIPRSKGGKNGPTVTLHHLCHKEIHITLSETELARTYNNLEALRTHPRLQSLFHGLKKGHQNFCPDRVCEKKSNYGIILLIADVWLFFEFDIPKHNSSIRDKKLSLETISSTKPNS